MGKRDQSQPPAKHAGADLAGGRPVSSGYVGTSSRTAAWFAAAERLLGIGAFHWAPGSERMVWSDGLYALLGYAPEVEPTYHNFVAAIHPEDRPSLLVRLENALDSATGFSLQVRLAEGGRWPVVRVAAEPVTANGRRVIGLDAVLAGEPDAATAGATGERVATPLGVDKELTRATLDAAGDAIFAFDGECRFMLWNKAAEKLTGKPAGEVVGTEVLAVFPFLRELGFDVLFERALAGECVRRRGCHIRFPPQGLDRYYDVDIMPLRGLGGAIIGGAGVLHDVTALKRAEETLRQREQEFEAIAENSPDLIAEFDREHRFIYVNRRVEAITGRPRSYFVGSTHGELGLPAEQQARWDALLEEAFARRAGRSAEFSLVDLDGELRTFEWLVVPERTEGERVLTVLGIARDVTERKRMEEALVRGEREFRTLAENVPDVITRLDRSLRPLYTNRTSDEHAGAAPEDYITSVGEDGNAPDGQRTLWSRVLPKVFEAGEAATLEFFVPTATGTRVYETRVIPEAAEDGRVQSVITLSRDITERKRTEDELRHAYCQLKRAMDELRTSQQHIIQIEKLTALGTLAAGIAHELNNPMMGVMNYVDYALRVAVNPAAKEMLVRASRELERIRGLLTNMLAFTRPVDEPVKAMPIEAAVKDALSLLAPELRARGIEVTLDLAPGLPAVLARERQLQQVFVNVLMNARDALEYRHTRRLHIGAEVEDGKVRVDFTDSGPGIPAEIEDKIFDPFFTTKPPGRGTGLGLSISRSIMLDLGGDMRHRRAEGGGTTISVVVPSASAHEDSRS
ncbi:MAG: PAS domain-containing protein [Thiohalomonadaceae bacterium]